ncbi:MAG: peptidoglycan-binding domain-containing protein [Candidatus Omnitrophica bacterium]|nr:peptidoglycan-binding domain-containing protein [Candidatus Omnitrophota bacterium]
MVKKLVVISVFSVSLVSLAGCATSRNNQQQALEAQGLRTQVQALESQLQEKDQEIARLKEAPGRTQESEPSVKEAQEVKQAQPVPKYPTMKLIQTALKNAGYEVGTVDGHKGKKTIDAIRAFQKANGLRPDGKVGKKTWELLKPYLQKQVK